MTAFQEHWIVALRITHLLRNRTNEYVVETKTGAQVNLARHLLSVEVCYSCSHGFLSRNVLWQRIRRCNKGHEKRILLVDIMDLAIESIDLCDEALPQMLHLRTVKKLKVRQSGDIFSRAILLLSRVFRDVSDRTHHRGHYGLVTIFRLAKKLEKVYLDIVNRLNTLPFIVQLCELSLAFVIVHLIMYFHSLLQHQPKVGLM